MDSSSSEEDEDEDIEDEEKKVEDDDDDHSDVELPSPAAVVVNVANAISVPRVTPPVAPVVKPAEADDEDSVTGTTIESAYNGC